MMTVTVFLSGSRKISRLNDAIRGRLQKIVEKQIRIVVGDANGADRAFQHYLSENKYENVVVFCAGPTCRNNVGSWQQRNIPVARSVTGREFYAQKDKAMAAEADYGFVLWDGKSAGSISNVLELLKNGKPVVVYFGPDKSFHAIKEAQDIATLMQRCDFDDYRSIDEKIHVERRLRELYGGAQGSLSL
jgi:hypothetical protein